MECITFAIAYEDDRTMTRDRHFVHHDVSFRTGESLPDFDLFTPYDCILPTRWRLVVFGVVGVKLLQVKILNVWSNVGEAPRDVIVMADDDAGQSGSSNTRNANARRAEVDHVPDRRCCCTQVRIVRE